MALAPGLHEFGQRIVNSMFLLGLVILFLVIGAQFFCGMSSVTANSRMIYAFARERVR